MVDEADPAFAVDGAAFDVVVEPGELGVDVGATVVVAGVVDEVDVVETVVVVTGMVEVVVVGVVVLVVTGTTVVVVVVVGLIEVPMVCSKA